MKNFKSILSEYEPDLLRDEDSIYRLKAAINNLPDTDKAIFILYADLKSMSKTAKVLSVSPSTIYINICRIRKAIIEQL